MESISSTLQAKLRTRYQTIDNDSDPHMEVIMQRAAKYMNQGTFLTPQTVRTGTSLERLDVTVRREHQSQEPTEIVMIYIENGEAKVATLPYVNTPDDLFVYQYTIGPATDVACDFDGRFAYISDRTSIYFDTSTIWALVTFGEPYFAVVNGGVLTLHHSVEAPLVMASDVTRVSLLRGWKSISDVLNDQGLICAYVKTDGKVYYQNYCELVDGTYAWDIEREVAELTAPITDVALFRTADYRFGFIVESDGVLSWAITERNWSGMANAPENITSSITAVVSSVAIRHLGSRSSTEYILAEIQATNQTLYALIPEVLAVFNIDDGFGNYGRKVIVEFDERIFNEAADRTCFALHDSLGGSWPSQNIAKLTPTTLEITFGNFNNAYGPVTLEYNPGSLRGDIENLIAMEFIFTPLGLVPTELPVPALVSLSNTDAKTIIVEFDIPVESSDLEIAANGFSVSGEEYTMLPGGLLMPVNYVVDQLGYQSTKDEVQADLSSASMTNTQLSSGRITLEEL